MEEVGGGSLRIVIGLWIVTCFYFYELLFYCYFELTLQLLFCLRDDFLVALVVLFEAYALLTVSVFGHDLTFVHYHVR